MIIKGDAPANAKVGAGFTPARGRW